MEVWLDIPPKLLCIVITPLLACVAVNVAPLSVDFVSAA